MPLLTKSECFRCFASIVPKLTEKFSFWSAAGICWNTREGGMPAACTVGIRMNATISTAEQSIMRMIIIINLLYHKTYELPVMFKWMKMIATARNTSFALFLVISVIAFPSGRSKSPFVQNHSQKLPDLLLPCLTGWSGTGIACGWR